MIQQWEEVKCVTKNIRELGLLDYCETQNFEYQNSKELAKDVTKNIILRNKNFQTNTEEIKISTDQWKSDKNIIYHQKHCYIKSMIK